MNSKIKIIKKKILILKFRRMPVPWAEKSCLEKFAMILLVAVGTPIGKFEI